MALQTANQFQLVPEISQLGTGFAQGAQLGQQFQQGKRQRADTEQQQQLGQFSQQALGGDQQALGSVAAIDPQRANQIQTFLSGQSEIERDELLRENDVLTRTALDALSLPTEQQRQFLQQKSAEFKSAGRDTSNIDNALAGDDALLNQALTLQARAGQTIQQLAERQFPKKETKSPFQRGAEGTVFDPNTGTSTIDPVVAKRIEKTAEKKGGLDFKDRQSLNKDVTSLLKNTVEINNTAKDLSKLGEIKSGPASIALVFKFMKALDPTSVVREGEFATAENSAGIPESISNTYNKLIRGERLGDLQIKQFIETAQSLSNSAVISSNEQISSFLDTFVDTIPDDLKSSIKNRIPSIIEVKSGFPGPVTGQQNKELKNQTDKDLMSF